MCRCRSKETLGCARANDDDAAFKAEGSTGVTAGNTDTDDVMANDVSAVTSGEDGSLMRKEDVTAGNADTDDVMANDVSAVTSDEDGSLM